MGRHRAFDVDTALDQAMKVFWLKGYEGASVSDLTEAMGINSPSLYAAFGSKEGLFTAVLNHYDATRSGLLSKILDAPTAREVASGYLCAVADFATDRHHPPGCLLVQAGLSCADDMVPRLLARHRAAAELALRERFKCAKKTGDLPPNANEVSLARYLLAVGNGICIQASTGTGRKELRWIAEMALAGWPSQVAKSKRGQAGRSSALRVAASVG